MARVRRALESPAIYRVGYRGRARVCLLGRSEAAYEA